MPRFEQELRDLINRHSIENQSDTPDFVLEEYLMACLRAYNGAVLNRERLAGRPVRHAWKGAAVEEAQNAAT